MNLKFETRNMPESSDFVRRGPNKSPFTLAAIALKESESIFVHDERKNRNGHYAALLRSAKRATGREFSVLRSANGDGYYIVLRPKGEADK